MFNDMTESNARISFNAACGLSVFAAAASMMLGVRGQQLEAAIFLCLSVPLCIVSIMAYKQYTLLRDRRWKLELKKSEDELNQVLNHARMNIIVNHITGPLSEEITTYDMVDQPRERSVAKP
jgi:hypothetical protein